MAIPTLACVSASRARLVDANVAARSVHTREPIEPAAMTLPLAIARTGLLGQHLGNPFSKGVGLANGADLEFLSDQLPEEMSYRPGLRKNKQAPELVQSGPDVRG
jgi:hypothetical protein